MSEQIVQIRKKGGLHTIKSKAGIVTPKVFHQDKKDTYSDGSYTGDYKGQTILKTKRYISPTWEDLDNKWAWGETPQKLMELVNKMNLRYSEKHERSGQLIKCKDISTAEQMLTYRLDPVFTHSELYGAYYMQDARLSLNLKDPKQEFMFYCMKGSSVVDDKSDSKLLSGFIRAGLQYELVSPKAENKRKKEDVKKEVKAFQLFGAMDSNPDKLRQIAEIMQIPGYSSKMDDAALYVLMRDMAVTNLEISPKYDKSYMARFCELAEREDERLELEYNIIRAKKLHKLVGRKGYYMFQGKRLDNISNDVQLINYFMDLNNQEDYIELIELIK